MVSLTGGISLQQCSLKVVYAGIIVSMIGTIWLFAHSNSVYATSNTMPSWTKSKLIYSVPEDQAADINYPVKPCMYEETLSVYRSIVYGPEPAGGVCMYQADGFRFGYSTRIGGAVVQMLGENMLYGTNLSPVMVVPNNNGIISLREGNVLRYYSDPVSRFHGNLYPNGETSYYTFDAQNPDFSLINLDGSSITVRNLSFSNNGRWMIVYAQGIGYLRINLTTFDVMRVMGADSNDFKSDTNGLAISNDGNHIASTDNYEWPHSKVVDVIDTCGDRLADVLPTAMPSDRTCPHVIFQDKIEFRTVNDSNLYFVSGYYPRFNDQGNKLTFLAARYYYGESPNKWITISTEDNEVSGIDYLALGDSYSSGEGDIGQTSNGSNYYLPLTDLGPDNCHISSRSFPFLLRDYYTISPNNMKSVACSSARVTADYFRSSIGYLGQGNRLRDRLDLEQAKQIALEKFIPGRVPQIEFIKKYQPKVITLTGGGNDVGFADILKYCASPDWKEFVMDNTCGYAKSDSELRKMLGAAIRDQYYSTIRLIEAIKQVSSSTQIYIIGYPSFVAGSNSTCALNSGVLDGDERDMINQGISYMNTVLKSAADNSNVTYIDIEDSLKGGRLCEGSEYVTGVWDTGLFNEDDRSQSFHPNAKGHQKIASIITANDNFSFEPRIDYLDNTSQNASPPSPPAYFNMTEENTTVQQRPISAKNKVTQGNGITLQASEFSFKPNSMITATLHSNPTSLGSYASSDDGSFLAQITLPASVSVGYHVLTLSGVTTSGEPLLYYEFIQVQSSNINDLDGDGIPNEIDNCKYIAHWYNETSGEDECVKPIQSEPLMTVSSHRQDTVIIPNTYLQNNTPRYTDVLGADIQQREFLNDTDIRNEKVAQFEEHSSFKAGILIAGIALIVILLVATIKWRKSHAAY